MAWAGIIALGKTPLVFFDESVKVVVPWASKHLGSQNRTFKQDWAPTHGAKTTSGLVGWKEAVNTWMKFQSGLNCSNGIVSLLKHCIRRNNEINKSDLQYVLHKAQNFLPPSKVHCFYVAVLVTYKRIKQAGAFMHAHKDEITPQDCVMVMRFMNALKPQHVDEYFMENFLELCLNNTTLCADSEWVKHLQTDVLKLCEQRNLLALSLRLYEKFKMNGVDISNTGKMKIWKMISAYEQLARRWIFTPDGLIRLKDEDSDIWSNDVLRIQQQLEREVEDIKATTTTTTTIVTTTTTSTTTII
uniref:Cyclin N-terminal domain-containing protein n=1 Tax=Heterorhabditis bacteriophora TaxID=37862 RepID=A0A1I7XMD4_HETBA